MKLIVCILILALEAMGAPEAIAIVTVPGVEAYNSTVAGIREQFPQAMVWDARDESRIRGFFVALHPQLAIAVGAGGAAVLLRLAPPDLPLVYSVALAGDPELDKPGRFRSVLTVDLPPDVLMAEVARRFPGRTRIGVIRGPVQTPASMRSLEHAGRRAGLTLEIVTCEQARDLVAAFLRLQSHADLVWCPPDAALYTSATLKPLLVASLTSRLPIIGFSEQFVQAGALFGGSADFVEVGRQTAALAARVLHNEQTPARQAAREFRFVYNQRVSRLLGVKAAIPADPVGLVVIH
jgi:ABC-type uncharacterized transport system substrate-binding protein